MDNLDSSDLQSWCEVPSIAHFCSLFRQAFDLLEFDIQEFEESLLLMGSEDDSTKLVIRLLIRLLRGCSKSFTSNINEDNYNTYLRRLFLSKREEAEEENLEFNFNCNSLVDEDIDFPDLTLKERVLILQQLCEFRLDAPDVFDKLRNLEASSLRVDPLGTDSESVTYWYFYGTRLYREIPPTKMEHKSKKHATKEKDKKKKKKDKKKKKKKKRGDSISSAEDEEPEPTSTWSVACLTLQDWEDLTNKYKKSKKKSDRDLYDTLNDNFLPEIVKMFAEKEREDRKRLLMMQPKRASNRLELKRKEQEERDRELALKLEEERSIEEEYDEKLRLERERHEKEEQELTRQERQKQRELMKELREQRASEREVAQAIAMLKEQQSRDAAKRKSKSKVLSDGEEPDDEKSDIPFQPPKRISVSRDEDEDDEEDDEDELGPDDDEVVMPAGKLSRKERGGPSKSNFTNALLRAGTKSTKDSMLDKPVRKQPGLLLETAGRSLMQKRNSDDGGVASKPSTSISFGLLSSKISFGLYEGHLPMDHSSYTKTSPSDDSRLGDSGLETTSLGGLRTADGLSSTKKVFSNWGGEFFKKNLDYRANTNKILEKMNLNVAQKTSNGDSMGADRFKTSLFGASRSFGTTQGIASGATKRPSIDSISSDSSSPAKKMKSSLFNTFA